MPASPKHSFESDYFLPIVKESTVEQVQDQPRDVASLDAELVVQNPELEHWLRRETTKAFPDIHDREKSAQITMDALRLIQNQATINHLNSVFGMNTEEISASETSQRPPAA